MPNERQRREAERRRLQRQLQRRAEREARRRRFAVIASIVGTLVLIAVIITVVVFTGNDNSPAPAANTQPPGGNSASFTPPTSSAATSTPATTAAYPCTWKPSGSAARQVSPPPTTKPPKKGTVDLLVNTSRGPMTFQLNRAEAPCAVESFASLAEQHYYDQTQCHRLTTSGIYVLQCGDPTGTGSGGPGYSFADELSGHEKYTRGVIAMANSGPNTNGSQFFIVYKDSSLPPSYTIFGKVTSGMKIVDKVAAAGTDNSNGQGDGKPKLPISLTSVAVVQ